MLSLGFIGGSYKSAVGYTHFISSKMDNKWCIKTGCFSTHQKQNIESSEIYGIPDESLYNNWKELLDNEKNNIDAVSILTPTPSHFEIVMECLNRNIPVICEKSLTTNKSEVEKIIEIRDLKKGFLAVTYNYSGYPMVRELKHIINNGVLGKILHFQIEMPQEGYIRTDSKGNKPKPQDWRLSDGRIPIIYLDLCSHLHQLIYYLIKQKPIEVIANQKSYGWFSDVIDNVTCLCNYTNDIQGQLWFSKSSIGSRNGLKLRIYGSNASIEWYQSNPEELLLSYSDGKKEFLDRASIVEISNIKRYNRFKAGHPAGFIEAFANIYYDIADCLIEYKKTNFWKSDEIFSAEIALDEMKFFEAMIISLETKTWQTI